MGNNNKKYPSLTSEILSEGHLIGNHTFNHKILTGKNFTKTDLEINSFNELMRDQFNCNIKYFRPPHGKMNLKIQRIIMEKNMKNIMWSLLTYDFRNNFDIVKKSVKKYLKKNSIIVLHDSLKSKDIIVDSINLILDESSKKGFEIGKPEECLK